jgi:type II secretory pathway pseudopilin PulG
VRNRSHGEAHAGFSLIEALVAFAALALVDVVAFELLSGAAHGTIAAERRQALLTVAEARLAEVGAGKPLMPGSDEGVSDGASWRRDIRPRDHGSGGTRLLQLYDVTVTARSDGRSVTLSRLVATPAAP